LGLQFCFHDPFWVIITLVQASFDEKLFKNNLELYRDSLKRTIGLLLIWHEDLGLTHSWEYFYILQALYGTDFLFKELTTRSSCFLLADGLANVSLQHTVPVPAWTIIFSCQRHSTQSKEICEGKSEPPANLKKMQTNLSYPRVFRINRKEFPHFDIESKEPQKIQKKLRLLTMLRTIHHITKTHIISWECPFEEPIWHQGKWTLKP